MPERTLAIIKVSPQFGIQSGHRYAEDPDGLFGTETN